nr:unnamed protein product [Haemonchus contortus]
MLQTSIIILFLGLLNGLQYSEASFFGCGCRQCNCAQSYYPSYQPSYQPTYASYYPTGPVAGYVLRPIGQAPYSGYAVSGVQAESGGIPVVHNKHGHIGYLRTNGNFPMNGPFYWQPAQGAPYETVSLGKLLL